MHSFLIDFLILTSVSIFFVPVFKKLGLGAILAYLFGGVIIGPYAFAFIKDAETILHFSELGVVFLLFIIGLELAPEKLWKMRKSIFGFGLFQVLITGSLFTIIGVCLGAPAAAAYVIGFGLALSSTAFCIQILEDNQQMNTTHGQGAFSVLMFQDLAVVPLLASLALFGTNSEDLNFSILSLIKGVVVIGGLIWIGPLIIRKVLRLVADTKTHEVFIAVSLVIVIGTGLLLESVGLSMGMGAFLAGVLLANSEYRHELESNILPFKSLLLGLFFIAVGMSLDLSVLQGKLHWVCFLALIFMSLKWGVVYVLARIFSYPNESSRNMAFTLCQGGEFAFVLFGAATASGLLDKELSSMLSASVTLSMAASPFLFSFNQAYLRKFSEISERPFDKIETQEVDVVIAGFGRFGQIISRFLRSQNVSCTILEHSAGQVDIARKYGTKIYYGDASRLDILKAAGASQAKYFVLATDEPSKSVEIAGVVKKHFPHLKVIARARNRQHVLNLMELGVTQIHRETFLTSLEMAKDVLLDSGEDSSQVDKGIAKFRTHDEEILKAQYSLQDDEEQFLSFTSAAIKDLEEILRADRASEKSKQKQF